MTTTIIAYRTPPQQEAKAAREARAAGYRAYVPIEKITHKTATGKPVTRKRPVAPGYVFAAGRPGEAKHIRTAIGTASRVEVARLYVRTSKTQRTHAFAPGDTVTIKRGRDVDLAATIVEVLRVGWYKVRVELFGRGHEIKIRESDIARMHPGS